MEEIPENEALENSEAERRELANKLAQELEEVSEKNMPVPAPGKVLGITVNTPGMDYNSCLDQVLQVVNIADIISKIEKGTQFVVQVPVKFQSAYESGEMFIMQNAKTGKMWPSLMKIAENGRKQVVTPLEMSEQTFVKGNPLQEISAGYHNFLMQQEINELKTMITCTYEAVKRVEHGQMDDRIGLLEAGKEQILLAMSMQNEQERMYLINSGRQNMITAQVQIGEMLKRRVAEFEPLPETGFGRFLKGWFKDGYLTDKDREVLELEDIYDLYLRATKYIASSFAYFGDITTAQNTFIHAEQFVNEIDFTSLKSIEGAHENKDLSGMFFNHPKEYISEEKNTCLDAAKEYDYIAITVSGEKLLEVCNGK